MKKYKIKYCTAPFLEKRGFRYNYEFSNEEDTYYSLIFPVYKWQDFVTLRAEIRVCLQTKEVWVDVYDGSTNFRTRYAPFYYYQFGNFEPIVEAINKKINAKMDELNIEEVKREYGRRTQNKNQVFQERERRNNRTNSEDNTRGLDRS